MFPKNTIKVIARLDKVIEIKKSIVETNIVNLEDVIEDSLFSIKFTPHNINTRSYDELMRLNVTTEEALGLLFLSYITLQRKDITYSSLWPIVVESLKKYETIGNSHFISNFFLANARPKKFLEECIYKACLKFNLRHAFNHKLDQHYLRNTIFLQFGLLNKFTHLNDWISGYHNQTTLKELLNKESENYSKSFDYAWRVLKRYRDNAISKEQATSQLENNSWFKDLDIEDLLEASRLRSGKKFITEEKIENIFTVSKIYFVNNILQFNIAADDLYALHLYGREYKIYINESYVGLLLYDNESKVLKLDRDLIIEDPESYIAFFDIRNEDNETVYKEELILFDFQDGILIFDDHGNYYKNLHSKLNPNKQYSLLIDSELETNLDIELLEYFDGYVHLVPSFNKNSKLEICDEDGDILYEPNFTDEVVKPSWIDDLVIFYPNKDVTGANKNTLTIGEEVSLSLKILNNDQEAEEQLKEIDANAKIMRWRYSTESSIDKEELLKNNYEIILDEDTITNRKHTLHIRVGKQTYIKTLYLQLFEKYHNETYRVFQKEKNSQYALPIVVNKDDIVTDTTIEKNYLMISTFMVKNNAKELPERFQSLQSKSRYLRQFKINQFLDIKEIPKYGEDLYASEKMFNTNITPLFKTRYRGIIKTFDTEKKEVVLHENSLSNNLKMIVLDDNYQLSLSDIDKSSIVLDSTPISVCIVADNTYVGSYYIKEELNLLDEKIDMNVLQYLRFSFYPFAASHVSVDYCRKRIAMEPRTLIDVFFSDKFTINGIEFSNRFDDISSVLDHILYEVQFDIENTRNLLQEIVIDSKEEGLINKAFNIPVFLFSLISVADSKAINSRFLFDISEDVDMPEEIDETFIERMIELLINHKNIKNIEKLNLKTIMHHKDKKYYIKKALERMING